MLSPQATPILNAALVLFIISLTIAIAIFIKWFCEPIIDAARLAKEDEPAQERTYEEPVDNGKPKLYVCIEYI